jgi:hypothetical protein
MTTIAKPPYCSILLVTRRLRCLANSSSTAIGARGAIFAALCFPCAVAGYGCVDRALVSGPKRHAGSTLVANYYDYMMYRLEERQLVVAACIGVTLLLCQG